MRRTTAIGVSLLFLVLLYVPLVATWLAPESARLSRSRQDPFPAHASFAELPEKLEGYFSDRLGFRRALVTLYNRTHLALAASPNTSVLVGENGWFFLRKRSWEYYQAKKLFQDKDLAVWKERILAYRNWLAQRGIAFLLVVAPNKESIYEDEVPEPMRRRGVRRRLDQLMDYLGERLLILDLRKPLLDAKRTEPLYAKLDSHWNGRGAAVAVQEIVARVSAELHRPIPLPHFHLVEKEESGDLAGMLELDSWLEEKRPHIVADPTRAVREQPPADIEHLSRSEQAHLIYTVPDPSLPTAVIIRDSFGTELIPLLSEAFRRSEWFWTRRLLTREVERAHPDVLIWELVERALQWDPPDDPFQLKRRPRKRPGSNLELRPELHDAVRRQAEEGARRGSVPRQEGK